MQNEPITVRVSNDSVLMKFLRRYALMLTVLLILGGATVYYFVWHLKPFTQNAFLFADTRPVTPLVAGYLTEIHVQNNRKVKKGDPLFSVFKPPYTLQRIQLEAQIKAATAEIASLSAQIDAAESTIAQQKAALANLRYLSHQANTLYTAGQVVSRAYQEERLRAREGGEATLKTAEYTAESLRHTRTAKEHTVEQLRAALKLAVINESQTTVYALSDGTVTNLTVSPGGYYPAGSVLCAFIDTTCWRVQANFKESELSSLQEGQAATIWVRQYPGKVFHGVVEAIGFGTERRDSSSTGLSVVAKENEWFLLPQRFPVQIRVTDPDPRYPFHMGGSVYVELDGEAHPVRQFFWQLFLWE